MTEVYLVLGPMQTEIRMIRRAIKAIVAVAVVLLTSPEVTAAQSDPSPRHSTTYDQQSVLEKAEDFFGEGAKGLAKVVERVFQQQGEPNGYIMGQEMSGALVVGARYGDGTLSLKGHRQRRVHWSGPSIGIDAGGNASKVFVLVYNLDTPESIYQRFPAVDGSLYFIAGVSVNYQQAGNIVLVPIRLGAGLRSGINVGYMHYRRRRSWNPF